MSVRIETESLSAFNRNIQLEDGDLVEAKYRDSGRSGRGQYEIVDIAVLKKRVYGEYGQFQSVEASDFDAANSTTREILAILKGFAIYPFDEKKDLEFVERLISTYSPMMGEKTLINDITSWTRKTKLLGPLSPRDQLGNWLDNKVKFLEQDGKLKAY